MKFKTLLGLIDNFALIEVSGAKAAQFLQGQFTCDILAINHGQAALGACCDHKGRMLANGWIGRQDQDFFIFLPENMADFLITHLQKFAVFSKVNLSRKNDWLALNYSGPSSLPSLPDNEFIHSKLTYFSEPDYFLHWLIGPAHNIRSIQQTLALTATDMTTLEREYATLATHLIFIEPKTQNLFIPQMIGLEKLGGVSFKKGCYVGQEVIARTQHLGQLKRHLYPGHSDYPLTKGEPLFNTQKEIAGHIAASSLSPQNSYLFLAVLQDKFITEPIFDSQGRAAIMETK